MQEPLAAQQEVGCEAGAAEVGGQVQVGRAHAITSVEIRGKLLSHCGFIIRGKLLFNCGFIPGPYRPVPVLTLFPFT